MVRLCSRLHITPEIIDLGSGMFGEMEQSFRQQFNKKFPVLKSMLMLFVNSSFYRLPYEQRPWLMTEPGTTIVDNAFSLYYPVASSKKIKGKDFIGVIESIYNIGAEPAKKKNLPFTLIHSEKGNKTHITNADVVGYHLSGIRLFAKRHNM